VLQPCDQCVAFSGRQTRVQFWSHHRLAEQRGSGNFKYPTGMGMPIVPSGGVHGFISCRGQGVALSWHFRHISPCFHPFDCVLPLQPAMSAPATPFPPKSLAQSALQGLVPRLLGGISKVGSFICTPGMHRELNRWFSEILTLKQKTS
jgi:hypothetical protein